MLCLNFIKHTNFQKYPVIKLFNIVVVVVAVVVVSVVNDSIITQKTNLCLEAMLSFAASTSEIF